MSKDNAWKEYEENTELIYTKEKVEKIQQENQELRNQLKIQIEMDSQRKIDLLLHTMTTTQKHLDILLTTIKENAESTLNSRKEQREIIEQIEKRIQTYEENKRTIDVEGNVDTHCFNVEKSLDVLSKNSLSIFQKKCANLVINNNQSATDTFAEHLILIQGMQQQVQNIQESQKIKDIKKENETVLNSIAVIQNNLNVLSTKVAGIESNIEALNSRVSVVQKNFDVNAVTNHDQETANTLTDHILMIQRIEETIQNFQETKQIADEHKEGASYLRDPDMKPDRVQEFQNTQKSEQVMAIPTREIYNVEINAFKKENQQFQSSKTTPLRKSQFVKQAEYDSPNCEETILIIGEDVLFMLDRKEHEWRELDVKPPCNIWDYGAQFVDNNLYIFGGYALGYRKSTYKLTKDQEWEQMADMNEGRWCITSSSVILHGKIWVLGGTNDEILNSVEMYDPMDNKWIFMRGMNECRSEAAAAVVDEKVFCCGGWKGKNEFLSSVEFYDAHSDIWTLICPIPKLCEWIGAVETNGRLLVIGEECDSQSITNPVWLLDFKNMRWIVQPRTLQKREHFTTVRLGEEIFIYGGSNTIAVEISNDGKWRTGPALPQLLDFSPYVVVPMEFAKNLLKASV